MHWSKLVLQLLSALAPAIVLVAVVREVERRERQALVEWVESL